MMLLSFLPRIIPLAPWIKKKREIVGEIAED